LATCAERAPKKGPSSLSHPIINGVVEGRDGQLFLASGGHNVLDYCTGARRLDAASIDAFRDNINARRTYLAGKAEFQHLIFPDKQSVLTDQFVVPDPVCHGAVILARDPELQGSVLYPLQFLRAQGAASFMKTDTHMTDRGTIEVLALLLERICPGESRAFRQAFLDRLQDMRPYTGDLGIKLNPQRQSDELFVRADWHHSWATNTVSDGKPGLIGNNGMVDIYMAPESGSRGRLLWFGDSFGRSACRFLSFLFREVVFMRTPFFHAEIYDLIRPDIVITENVERYLDNVRPDAERPHFLLYPHLSGLQYQPDQHFTRILSAILSYGRPPYDELLGGGLGTNRR
jgi:hypothetical protein